MSYKKVVNQDNFNEWQEAHKTGIGASQIAAVLGEHRFASRLRVWAEKTGRLEPYDFSDNEAVQMGIELEPFVANKYQQRTERIIDRGGDLLRSIEHPWAICTPDYWTLDSNGEHSIPVQIKTTNAFRLNDWASGPPNEVWWQVQHEMLVTGAPWASVGVLVGGQKFMWADVERDEQAIERIIAEGSEFWQNVLDKRYPEPDGNSAETILELHPTASEGESLVMPYDATEWDKDLGRLKFESKNLDEEIKTLEGKIKLAIGPAERGVLHDGSGAFTYKNQSRWNYKPMSSEVMPTEEGQIVMCVATKSDFRVLRKTTNAG